MTPPGARYDRYFYASAAVVATGAVVQAVLALWVGVLGLALAMTSGCIAAYMASYPWLRARWYEAGHDAGIARIPTSGPGGATGYALFGSEPIGGDPHRQTVQVVTRGVTCRALRNAEGGYTAEWIVTLPLPADTRIERTHLAQLPAD
jgi:hypothetical protein